MKQLFENFNKYVNEMSMSSEEDLNTQIALVIARSGLQDTSLGMSDDDLKDLVVYIYEKEFDKTGEGWNPYDEDLAQIRDVLTPDDEEDRDNYDFDLSEIIREEVRLFLEKRKKRKKAGTESSKEKSLRDWFGRKGAKGKKGGWVDCNAPDGKGGYKACGREKGEKRKKYPACRPTPAACKERGKGKTWGKKAKKKKKMKESAEEYVYGVKNPGRMGNIYKIKVVKP